MSDWLYSRAVSRERVDALLRPTSVDDIARTIAEEMTFACCHFQLCDEHSDFGRVAYCIRVSEQLFDLFFNSPYGYRGAYFRGVGAGIDANARFIEVIAPRLLERSSVGASEGELQLIIESLRSNSAKVWLAENGLGACPNCEGEWGPPAAIEAEIQNGRWPDGQPGCLAPRGTKIRVFGAFLNDRKNELIPGRKRHRAREIHLCGWS